MKLWLSGWFMVAQILMSFAAYSATSPTNATPQQTRGATPATDVSPAVAEVLRLARSGLDDNVVVAYIENSSSEYDLNSDNIIYLHGLGLSSADIAAMIRHDQRIREAESAANINSSVSSYSYDDPPMPAQPAQSPDNTTAGIDDSDTSSPEADNAFYNSLAPYGSWSNLPGYGWGWQPTVAVSTPGWTPYCDGGQWFCTARGWFWNSYYPWGWAPFHYGRWCHNPRCGWMWFPGKTWAPSWVTWRTSKSGKCIGWAPLPPGSSCNSTSNIRFNNKNVGANCTFGLSASDFTFVNAANLGAVDLPSNKLDPSMSGKAFTSSRVINNFSAAPDASVSNWGPDPKGITQFNQNAVVNAQLHDTSSLSSVGVTPSNSPHNPATVQIFRPDFVSRQTLLSRQNLLTPPPPLLPQPPPNSAEGFTFPPVNPTTIPAENPDVVPAQVPGSIPAAAPDPPPSSNSAPNQPTPATQVVPGQAPASSSTTTAAGSAKRSQPSQPAGPIAPAGSARGGGGGHAGGTGVGHK